jgi:YhcH/YjgK/YiaL family protein
MIVDKLENVVLYPQIPDYAKNFILNLSKDISLGKKILENDDFANVETYSTKNFEDAKFEIHKKYIDIQLLISGNERIYIKHKNDIPEMPEYNAEKDIAFYSASLNNSDFVTLDGSNFVMIFPWEAHAPQVSLNNSQSEVKKVVLKIKV